MPYLELAGHGRIFYRRFTGDPDLPVLVFLHEGLGCTSMWRSFPEALCRLSGCRGLAYDRLGFGQSSIDTIPRTPQYLHQSARLELPAVLDALLPDQPHILVGHSDGGSIALLYAAGQPDSLQAVITMAAHVFVEPETISGIKQAGHAWQTGRLAGLERHHGKKTQSVFQRWYDVWTSPEFLDWNIEDCLENIKIPLLIMQGSGDQYGTVRQVESIAQRSAGRSQTALIEEAAHSPHLEAPDSVFLYMSEFIGSVPLNRQS